MLNQIEVASKLGLMLDRQNDRYRICIQEVHHNADMSIQVKDQLKMNYDKLISDNTGWLKRLDVYVQAMITYFILLIIVVSKTL